MSEKYTVCVTRDLTEQCIVEVTAKDAQEACEIARDIACNDAESVWEMTDYIGNTNAAILEDE